MEEVRQELIQVIRETFADVLETFWTTEFIREVAKVIARIFQALLDEGFSREEALKILSNLPLWLHFATGYFRIGGDETSK